MRPWLVLKTTKISFEEIEFDHRSSSFKQDILPYSPTLKVPVLWDGDLVIWDSLAICEYLAEKVPSLWPQDPSFRAIARSVTAEMHSGFLPLRRALPMELSQTHLSYESTPELEKDIQRIIQIWENRKGTFLFGDWSIADAFFTPVATRFLSYNIPVPPYVKDYIQTLLSTAQYQEWHTQALINKA